MAALPSLPARLVLAEEPFSDEELEDAVAAIIEERTVPARVGSFEINSLNAAEWAMRHLLDIERAEAEMEAAHAEWLAQVTASRDAERKRYAARKKVFTPALEQYAKNRRAEDEKNNKSTRVASGVIKTSKASKPKIGVANPDAVLSFARASLPRAAYEAITSKPSLLVSKIPDVFVIVRDVGKGTTRVALKDDESKTVPGVFVQEPTTTASVHPGA